LRRGQTGRNGHLPHAKPKGPQVTQFYRNMTEADYAAIPALRASWVKTLDASTPAHLFARMNADESDSDAFRIGRALHCRILRPADYASEFVVSPRFDRRTKDGKAEAEAFAAAAGGRTVVTADEQATVDGMAGGLVGHDAARELLAMCAEREAVIVGDIDGVPCKARLDAFGDGVLVDVKSCVSAHPRAFARAVCEYGYDLQMAFYAEMLRQFTGTTPESVCIVAVEKSAPHAVAVYEMRPTDIDSAYARALRSIRVYRECTASGVWPAYPPTVEYLQIPAWRYNNEGMNDG
jgi:hypothetical protein